MKTSRFPHFSTPASVSLVILLFMASTLVAQGWHVKKFSADIVLNTDGSFDVKETIKVDFQESKRGIIRKLPYRFTQTEVVNGEVAEGHVAGIDYLTPIVDIEVKDWTYSTIKSYSDYQIKIGESDVFLTGEQEYEISYKVYGAINYFSGSQEFYWNVNGNDWEVPFDNLDVSIHLPKNRKMDEDDLAVFTGLIGSVFNNSVTTIEPGLVKVAATRRLEAKEGLTVVMRFPVDYLTKSPVPLAVRADNYVIDSLTAVMTLLDGGAIDVQERIVLDVINPSADFKRTLEKNYLGPVGANLPPMIIAYELLESSIRENDRFETKGVATISGFESDGTSFVIQLSGGSFPKKGRYVIQLKYRIYGATVPSETSTALYIPWLNPLHHEPVAYSKVTCKWRQPAVNDMKDVLLKDSAPPKGVVTLDSTYLSMEFSAPLQNNEQLHFGRVFQGRTTRLAKIPNHVASPDQYFPYLDIDVEILPDGDLHVVNQFCIYRSSRYNAVGRPLTKERHAGRISLIDAVRPNAWGDEGRYLFTNLQGDGLESSYDPYADHHLDFPDKPALEVSGWDTFSYSYNIYGMVGDDGQGSQHLVFPLFETIQDMADSIHFRIRYPGGKVISSDHFQFSASSTYTGDRPLEIGSDVKMTFDPGEVEGEFSNGLLAFEEVVMTMRLPDGTVERSFSKHFHLFWINHKATFLPVLFLIPLLLAWIFFGRDKKFTTVVEFYPPSDLTPAEAGLLIDDHLHNRDLLALIYYWGAQGLITMEEIYDNSGKAVDYKFTKIKAIPADARKYEKTLFNGLFAAGNVTKVSSQKQKFYTYMQSARSELNTFAKTKGFYKPGTQGWSVMISLLGWVAAIVALITLGLVAFEATSWKAGRWEIPVGWAFSAALCFFFGKIMPKRAPFGQQQYQKMMGFREFVLRAEKDKLQRLVDTNPDYFGMTLPYAIAMGIATKWVDQFGDLLTMPPTYYKTDPAVSTFQLTQFNRMMQHQLDQMASSFNSTPPSTKSGGGWGSGGGSSSYRSSSSSYSSSSSSGSSGFSSGGGYSGGGYGGGGGSAW